MSGPSTSRANVNTAPLQGLTNPFQQLLAGMFGFQQGQGGQASPDQLRTQQALQNLPPWMRNLGQQNGQGGVAQQFQQQLGQQAGQFSFDPSSPGAQEFMQRLFVGQQPSDLQRQVGQTFSQALTHPTAGQRTFDVALPQIQQILGQASGEGIVGAAQPIFQRNLQLGADVLRQAGPRFASNTERLVGEQGQRSIQDFNLFAQQAMESGRTQQLAALAGLGGLGQGADMSFLNLLGGAGGFANQLFGQQSGIGGMNQQALLQLLGLGGQVATGPAALQQNPGGWNQFMQLFGAGAGSAVGLGWQPFANKGG